jgi:hypothetical protein
MRGRQTREERAHDSFGALAEQRPIDRVSQEERLEHSDAIDGDAQP